MKPQGLLSMIMGAIIGMAAIELTALPATSAEAEDKELINKSNNSNDTKKSSHSTVNTSTPPRTKEASGNTNRSPYSYKPTEQISEDLSVAFPVDI